MLTIPHLETNITTACQLSCVACNHLVPLWRQRGPWHASPQQVEADLARLAPILHTPLWGALGGEPLLNKELVTILGIVRASGIADRIEVWTNGLSLPAQKPAFWRAFDILVLSVYPGQHGTASYLWIEQKCAEEGVELVVKDERLRPNFRTLLEPTPTDLETTQQKYAQCFFRRYSRVVDRGFVFTCCCAPHMPTLLQDRPFGTDGISLDGITEETLTAYLRKTDPLGACTICAGRETAIPIQWREERQPIQWIAASKGVA